MIKSLFIVIWMTLMSVLSIAQETADSTNWKSGIELGTGLAFTGYNANLAYTLSKKNNTMFLGPKVVYSDANALFDTPWGIHTGYRRILPVGPRLNSFVSVTYQMVLFEYDDLEVNQLNSIHEIHFVYGLEYFLTDHWSIGNTLGAGGYIERLIDPFDERVDVIRGYSGEVRFYCGYHF